MDCCLMTPSHYLNQVDFSLVMFYSPESNFTGSAQATILYNEFEKCTLKIAAKSPRGGYSLCEGDG